jgi:outer membrane receptor for ferrienterochelin and colicins
MFRLLALLAAITASSLIPGVVCADPADPVAAADAAGGPSSAAPVTEIEVTARRLNEARAAIETQIGGSVYTIDSAALAALPGGDNTLLNQVVLQAPDVAQDSFGQFHVRGEHNGLQYRINGIVLPEGINVFGQSLDPRFIASMDLLTGALPAEYGLRTAGIIDITTKSGLLQPGGAVSIYGGSHSTLQPSVSYGGSTNSFSYFLSGDMLKSDLGIESPDGSSNPIHDHTTQYHGFGYLEKILNEGNRLTFIWGSSSGQFQIPNSYGLQPSLGLVVNGQTEFPSQNLDENQRELTHFAIVSLQHSAGAFDVQSSLIARYSSLTFVPDVLGDLLYDGIAQDAYKQDIAYAWQTDSSYKLGASHTLRGGLYVQTDRSTSDTTSQVLPVDAAGQQIGDLPISIVDNLNKTAWVWSAYLQDEWRISPVFTVNYGLRYDWLTAFVNATQLSPRLNAVWQIGPSTTAHAGYARYLSPPPFELVGEETISKFANTTAAPAVTLADPPQAERANYYDVGMLQKFPHNLSMGLEGYLKISNQLIDEGQFGAPIILTPFNYHLGRQYGVEYTINYTGDSITGYFNVAWQHAQGQQITSAQFNFSPEELAYIADHYIHLDHEQQVTSSGGIFYTWHDTRIGANYLVGSGLRSSLILADGSEIPNGDHLPYYTQVNLAASHVFQLGHAGTLTARVDVINVFDKVYEIRNGTGVGVGAPQYGPRRGLFFGLSKSL